MSIIPNDAFSSFPFIFTVSFLVSTACRRSPDLYFRPIISAWTPVRLKYYVTTRNGHLQTLLES